VTGAAETSNPLPPLSEREWTRASLRQSYVTNRCQALQRTISRGNFNGELTWEKLLEYFREMCRQAERTYP
jgi:hypothetical protein